MPAYRVGAAEVQGGPAPARPEPLADWATRVMREHLGPVCRAVDGDLVVSWGASVTWLRVEDGAYPSLHLYAPLVSGVEPAAEVYEAANRINVQLPVAKAVVVAPGDRLVLTADLPALQRSSADLVFAVELVARAADHFGRALQERFGGSTALDPEGGGDF